MKKNKGFTLIELLVVMSLIFIFIGFVAPKMFAYRDKAKDIKAINTAKQIQAATITTMTESDTVVTKEDIKTLTGVQVEAIENNSQVMMINFKSDKGEYSTEFGINNDGEFKVLKGSKQLYP